MAETTPPAPSLQGKTPADLPQIVGAIIRAAVNDVARGLKEPSEASQAAAAALKAHIASVRAAALEEAARHFEKRTEGMIGLDYAATIVRRLAAASPAPAKRAETEGASDAE